MQVGDLMLYNNRDHNKCDSLVLIMGVTDRRHRKVMFLKDGFITENCWIGYLRPYLTKETT